MLEEGTLDTMPASKEGAHQHAALPYVALQKTKPHGSKGLVAARGRGKQVATQPLPTYSSPCLDKVREHAILVAHACHTLGGSAAVGPRVAPAHIKGLESHMQVSDEQSNVSGTQTAGCAAG